MLSGTLDRQMTAYAVGVFEISDNEYDRQTQLVGHQLGGNQDIYRYTFQCLEFSIFQIFNVRD